MEAVTSLISAGADVNAVNQVIHGVCSISPHTWILVISVSLHMSIICRSRCGLEVSSGREQYDILMKMPL